MSRAHRLPLVILAVILTFASGISVFTLSAAGSTEFFVAPIGLDTNPGTAERPFAKLTRAQQAVGERIAQGLDSDVTISIRRGTYILAEPLVFSPDSGGTGQFAVTYAAYPGEVVVLTGGRRGTDWKQGDDEIWTGKTPEVNGDVRVFRNLFVNGRRAIPARTPNQDTEPNCVELKAVELSDDRSRFTLTLPPGVLGTWEDAADMEVMVAGNWAINRKRVESVDPAAYRAYDATFVGWGGAHTKEAVARHHALGERWLVRSQAIRTFCFSANCPRFDELHQPRPFDDAVGGDCRLVRRIVIMRNRTSERPASQRTIGYLGVTGFSC